MICSRACSDFKKLTKRENDDAQWIIARSENVCDKPLSSGDAGVIAHSGRFSLGEANRIRTFRTLHNLSMPYLLVYLMNEAEIGPTGDARVWIDYETLTILQRATA